MAEPGSLSCRSFFDGAFRESLERYRGKGHGSFGFNIRGMRGGRWTLDLDAARVVAGESKTTEVVLSMSEADFLAWLKNELDVVSAYQARRITVTGPISKLNELASFFIFASSDATGV
jgi:hypothetical protein